MTSILTKTGNDWCHLCGKRRKTTFVQFDIPSDAENEIIEPSRFVRMCKDCVYHLQRAINEVESLI